MSREMSSIDVGADSSLISNGTAASPIDLTSSPDPAHATLESSHGGHNPDGGDTALLDSFFNRRSDVRLGGLSLTDRYGATWALAHTDYQNILLLAAEFTKDELMNSNEIGSPKRNRSTGQSFRSLINLAILHVAQHSNVKPQQVKEALDEAQNASGATGRKNELATARKLATMKKNEAAGRVYNAQNATRSAPIKPITRPSTAPAIKRLELPNDLVPVRSLTGLPPSGSYAWPFLVPKPSLSLWRPAGTLHYQTPYINTAWGPVVSSQPEHYPQNQLAVNLPQQYQDPGTRLIRFQPGRPPGEHSTPWLHNGQYLREFERLPICQHPAAASQSLAITPDTATQPVGGRVEEGQAESQPRMEMMRDVIDLESSSTAEEEHDGDAGDLFPSEMSAEAGPDSFGEDNVPDAINQEPRNDEEIPEEDSNILAPDEMSAEAEVGLFGENVGALEETSSMPGPVHQRSTEDEEAAMTLLKMAGSLHYQD